MFSHHQSRPTLQNFTLVITFARISSLPLQSFLLLSQSDALHQVLTYRKILIDLKLSSATINQRLSALKSLVDYARKRGLCSFSLSDVKGLRSQKYRDTRGRTVDEYRSVLAEIDLRFWVNEIMQSVDCCGTML
jgi:hypothetical protein